MMKKISFFTTFVFIWAGAFSTFADEKLAEKQWQDEAAVSYISTSGNSENSTLAGKNLLKYNFTNRIEGVWDIEALKSKNGSVKAAERYATNLKLDYLFTEQFYAGLGTGWLKDKFAGIENRYYAGPLIGYKFFTGPKHFLRNELGLNYTKENYIDMTEEGFIEGRIFGLYEYAFTETAKFSQALEYLYNFETNHNYKAISQSALTVTITKIFSIKTSYEVRYVDQPIPDTLEKTDRVLSVSLVVNIE